MQQNVVSAGIVATLNFFRETEDRWAGCRHSDDVKPVIALAVVLLNVGCVHASNVTRVDDGSDPHREVYESSHEDREGLLRVHVRETVIDGERACNDIRLRKEYYTEQGELERRVVERQRCGYVELRYVERYSADGIARVREVFYDKDHDGRFERHSVREEPFPGEGTLTADRGPVEW